MADDRIEESCAAYAKRRGVTKMAVSFAIRAGRLRASVARSSEIDPVTGLGRVIGIKSITIADQEWEANSDMMKAPAPVREESGERAAEAKRAWGEVVDPAPRPDTLGDAAVDVKYWDAKLKELKYRQEAGELVEVKKIAHEIADMIAASKTSLLAIPSRVKQALPQLSVEDVATIEALVRETLEHLAIGKAEV